MNRRPVFAAAASLAALAAVSAAAEDGRVETGMLSCFQASRDNNVLWSETTYDCVFKREGMPDERYVGELDAIGLDLMKQTDSELAWSVLAPTEMTANEGILEGDYGGLSVGVAAGAGVGARALVGGFQDSVALQPFSVEGDEGYGASLTIDGFKLRLRP